MQLVPILDIEPNVIVNMWNETIGHSFPMTIPLWQQNTMKEPNVLYETSIALMEDGELLGFVVAKRYQENLPASMATHIGWIQCMLVRDSARNKGIGTRLIEHVEKQFTQQGIFEIRLGRDPWHYFPGVPKEDHQSVEWFKNKGYVAESIETDLMKSLSSSKPYQLTNPNEHYRVLTPEDLPELLQFLEQAFPGRWHYEALHYTIVQGTGREFIGFYVNNELKGFCRINDSLSPVIAQNVYWSQLFDGALGGIGPLGIERSIRGQQFGLDLVKAAANELMKRHVDTIVIDWTQLVPFYEKLGFTTWKQYITMAKTISAKEDST